MLERGFSMRALSEAAGLGPTTVRDILKRGRSPSLDTLRALAKPLEVTVSWLTDDGDSEPIDAPLSPFRRVPVVGYVGGGGEVRYPKDWPNKDAILVAGLTGGEALEVRGDSLEPVFLDGDTLIYGRPTDLDQNFPSVPYVVRLKDGRTFVRDLAPSKEIGRFTLISYKFPPILDAEVEWAAPVENRLLRDY